MSSVSNNQADLAAVALEFGPFLFAILYITGLTAYAKRCYSRATTPEQCAVFRDYFIWSFRFGLFLVLVCVSYWISDRIFDHEYAYAVKIDNAPLGVSFYGTDTKVTVLQDKGLPFQSVNIVFIREQRLLPNEALPIYVNEEGGGLGTAPSQGTPTKPGKIAIIKARSAKMEVDYNQLKYQ